MASVPFAAWMLEQEARALLTRLDRIKPFALHETMLPAASLPPSAQIAIEWHLIEGRRHLRQQIRDYIAWLRSPAGSAATPSAAQRRFASLKLRFNAVLTHFDLFNDALSQRSENDIGVWLSGLDTVSADALHMSGEYFYEPPLICYLDRGLGAAIRRARTRLPGGSENPVAVIRVPRERLIGSGIGSSLIHEVGHQAAALLDLVNSLRPLLRGLRQGAGSNSDIWQLWERWISEILADFWSVARLGITSTIGLIGVVSLPRAFIFRVNTNDPHPPPWIRVHLSCAMGQELFPHPQWARLSKLWESFYPTTDLDPTKRTLFSKLQASMPGLATLLAHHRPKRLRGRSLVEALDCDKRQPARLASLYRSWRRNPSAMYRAQPTLVLAVVGQARADARMSPEDESLVLAKLMTHWALRSRLETASACAAQAKPKRALQRNHHRMNQTSSLTSGERHEYPRP